MEQSAGRVGIGSVRNGDRVEVRQLRASDQLAGYSDWPHLAQVCCVERIVHRKGTIRWELAYAATGLDAGETDPDRLPEL